MIDLTSSRDEGSRTLAAWLSGARVPALDRSPARGEPAPLVLFLCRSNAALSVMAEAILRHLAKVRLRAASAGECPRFRVNPYALECLRAHAIATTGLRSKGCGEFFGVYRPPVHFLVTLSDVDEAKANWDRDPVRPVMAHWGMTDPATIVGSEMDIRVAFEQAFSTLDWRIRRFLSLLPLGDLNGRALTQALERIGEVL